MLVILSALATILNMKTTKSCRVELPGRDLIEVEAVPNANPRVKFIGCEALIKTMAESRSAHGDDPAAWPLPEGTSHVELLLKRLILELRGEWHPSFTDPELCHCRMIPTAQVEQAILAGAHTPEIVSRWTNASTSCGTCRPDVIRLLHDYLGERA